MKRQTSKRSWEDEGVKQDVLLRYRKQMVAAPGEAQMVALHRSWYRSNQQEGSATALGKVPALLLFIPHIKLGIFSHTLSNRSKTRPPCQAPQVRQGWSQCKTPSGDCPWWLFNFPQPAGGTFASQLLASLHQQLPLWHDLQDSHEELKALSDSPLPCSRAGRDTVPFSLVHRTVAPRGAMLHSPPPVSLPRSGCCEAL